MNPGYTGIYLPVITPFLDGEVDYISYEKIVDYYIGKGIHGIIPLGTTGEAPTISQTEYHNIIKTTIGLVKGRIPVFVGASGNDTISLIKKLQSFEDYDIEGYLIASPYYSRPSQKGIIKHYQEVAKNISKKIIIYNIPYRTGRNIENITIREIANIENIVGLKDSCGIIGQTLELLNNPPEDFCIFTGEDIMALINLTHGGAGGILASCHINTEKFIDIYRNIKKGELEKG
ncbi:MAG: dihydrodipicolinate synthase family protein, partial [Actinobacteria bacterium]|nr:dihydrodipicolinate synthase family protein [Actinomycetota bacterium]